MPNDQAREEALILQIRRHASSLFRKEATANVVDAAIGLVQDRRLPNLAVEFRLQEDVEHQPGRWHVSTGLGSALENYMAKLREMEAAFIRHSVPMGVTDTHQEAFRRVVEAAKALLDLGWPVNWVQNAQAILEPTNIGLRDGNLVDRFANPPATVLLGDELLLLGTVTFFYQKRSPDGLMAPFRAKALAANNRHLHEGVTLHLRSERDQVPTRFRYTSEWLSGRSRTSYRIAV